MCKFIIVVVNLMENAIETARLQSLMVIPKDTKVVRVLGIGAHGTVLLCRSTTKGYLAVKTQHSNNFNPCLSEFKMHEIFYELQLAPKPLGFKSATNSITMQYVPYILNKKEDLDEPKLLRVLKALTASVSEYVSRGNTHGDLHLGNIGSFESDFSTVTLLDFGRSSHSKSGIGDARVDAGMLMLSIRSKFPAYEQAALRALQQWLRETYAEPVDAYKDRYFPGDKTSIAFLENDKDIVTLYHLYAHAFPIVW